MDVTQELTDLRQGIHGCRLAAFADIGSEMVLSTASESKVQQEDLDALSASAHVMLDGLLGTEAAPMAAAEGGAVQVASVATASDTKIYLRSAARPAEALILVCDPSSDFSALVEAGRACLERFAASDIDAGASET